jgi:Matrixin
VNFPHSANWCKRPGDWRRRNSGTKLADHAFAFDFLALVWLSPGLAFETDMRKRHSWLLERLETRDCPAVFGNPWLNPNLTLSFAPDGTDANGAASRLDTALGNIPTPTRNREILRAFQTWVNVTNVNIGVIADGGQPLGSSGVSSHDPRFGDVRIAAAPLVSDDVALAYPSDPSAGTRAGDLTFNSTQPFGIGEGNAYDLYSITLHEAGHIFGLAGSTDPTSAMYQLADRVRSGLNPTDIETIQKLYGNRQNDAFEGLTGNSTIASATRLQSNGQGGSNIIKVAADMTTNSDVDVYSFKADKLQGGAFLFQLRTSGYSLLMPKVDILDGQGNIIATATNTTLGQSDVNFRLTNLKEGNTYYAHVQSADATFGVGGYKLELRPENQSDDDGLDDPETGLDDTASTSTSLSRLPNIGGTRQNFFAAESLSTTTDVDYYRVRSSFPTDSAAGVLTVSVVSTGANNIDPVVEVYDRNLVRQTVTIIAHDGGEYRVQLPSTLGNRDYFIAVKHGTSSTAIGNYSLGMDFGGPLVPLQTFAAAELSASAPASLSQFNIPIGQVLHLILNVDPSTSPMAMRISIFDSANRVMASRLVNAGESGSFNVLLPAGDYQLLVGGGTTNGSALPSTRFSVLGVTITDPIGPTGVDVRVVGTRPPPVPPTLPPPAVIVVPPVVVSTPKPVTTITAVTPTDPNILLVPPTDQITAPTLRLKPVTLAPGRSVAVGAAVANGSVVRSFNSDGTNRLSIVPFPGYTGSLRTAEADFNNDGTADLLVGTGPGSASRIAVIDGLTQQVLFNLDPFEATFQGGVFVATGDVTGDGVPDVVVTPDQGGGPRVRVFSGAGFGQVMDFFGIDDPAFRGGARASIGDINSDGTGDLIVSAGFEGGPRVATFDGASLAKGNPVKLLADFFAFEPGLRNGAYITAGDINGDGFAEIIAGGGPGGGPRVTAFSGKDLLVNQQVVIANFFDGDLNTRDGIRVVVKNLDGDTKADLVVGVGSHILGYSGADMTLSGTPQHILDVTLPYEFPGGVFVG